MNRPGYVLIGAQSQPWGTVIQESLGPDLPIQLCENDSSLVEKITTSPPSVVILDLHSFGPAPALSLLHRLRSQDSSRNTPVVLTGPAEDDLRLTMYEAGADDYCALPISPRELAARIRNRIRRAQSPSSEGLEAVVSNQGPLRCGQMELNLDTHEAVIAGQSVPLTSLEFALLSFFLRNPRKILSRAQILQGVWKVPVSTRTVDAHIALLRRKLPVSDYEIRTIYAAGYTLRPAHGISTSSVETL